jgi:hypothetical protein
MAGADDDTGPRSDLEKDGEEIHTIRLLLSSVFAALVCCSGDVIVDQDLAPSPLL